MLEKTLDSLKRYAEDLDVDMPKLLLVLAGPSGADKDTITGLLLDAHPSIHRVVTFTTRQRRPGETDGKQYHFISEEEFDHKVEVSEIIESNPAYGLGARYGMPSDIMKSVPSDKYIVLVEVDLNAKVFLEKRFSRCVTVLISPPSLEEAERRLRQRGGLNDDQIARHLEHARELKEVASMFTYELVNEDSEQTTRQLENCLFAELSSRKNFPDVWDAVIEEDLMAHAEKQAKRAGYS